MSLPLPLHSDPLEQNLEQTFYTTGFSSGHPHGELHGLYEGRSLGREKGWELWEEVGFYEGFARVWLGILTAGRRSGEEGKGGRAQANVEAILRLVATFPTTNDSTTLLSRELQLEAEEAARNTEAGGGEGISKTKGDDVDIPLLLSNIRSKYRATCGSLGVRPRLVATTGKVGE